MKKILIQNVYCDPKLLVNGDYAVLNRFAFTWAILSGINAWGYEDRWCFSTYEEAKSALDAWDGTGEPEGWHRHPKTGRRRDKDGKEEVWM
jgi:hypothetical protein